MQSNPLVLQPRVEKLPLKVCYIYDSDEDGPFHNDIFKAVKSICDELNLIFTSRAYNPIKYEEDCQYISSLPCFHVYYNRNCYDTFFANGKPVESLRKIMAQWLVEEDERKKKKERRKENWEKTVQVFTVRCFSRCSEQKVSQPQV